MLQIVVIHETTGAKQYSFDKHSVIVGRSAGSDVHLEVEGVSRYHARITFENDVIVVQDLGSTNGTYVGEEKIERKELSPQDVIVIGAATLSVNYLSGEEDSDESTGELEKPDIRLEKSTTVIDDSDLQQEPVQSSADKSGDTPPSMKSEDLFYWQSLQRFLDPIWCYITDPSVSEIMLNGPQEIYIERKGQLEKTSTVFSPHQLQAAVLNIAQFVGRRISEDEPYLDARLPDGSRVAVLLPPCSRKGISIAIRKFSTDMLDTDLLMSYGSLSKDMLTFIEACVVLKKNIVISGGTSSGKTSLLNALSGLIPSDERIITIEDSAELQLHQEHVLPMETKPPDKKGRGQMTIRDLVKASLRMRPDRVVVGEVRGGEALDLLQAMNTGHSGSMATVHASSPAQALTRLETLSLFSGLEIPIRALREQVSSAVDYVVQASRLPDHSRKVVSVAEVCGLDADGAYDVRDVFAFQTLGLDDGRIVGEHKITDHIPAMLEEMRVAGMKNAVSLFE